MVKGNSAFQKGSSSSKPSCMPAKYEKAASCCTCRRHYSGDEALADRVAQLEADLATTRNTKVTQVGRLNRTILDLRIELNNKTVDLNNARQENTELKSSVTKLNEKLRTYEEEDKELEALMTKKRRRRDAA